MGDKNGLNFGNKNEDMKLAGMSTAGQAGCYLFLDIKIEKEAGKTVSKYLKKYFQKFKKTGSKLDE